MIRLHRSLVVFWVGAGFILGLTQWWWSWLLLGLAAWWWHRRSGFWRLFFLGVALAGSFAVGWWRYQTYLPDTLKIPYSEAVNFIGTVANLPRFGKDQRLVIQTKDWTGYTQVAVPLYPRYQYGERLRVSCLLERPMSKPDFAYDKYLARYGILSVCSKPQIERLGSTAIVSPLIDPIYRWRLRLQQSLKQLYPEPAASLIMGVLLGVQDDIPADIIALFRQTGTIHILVVSGMHVVILAAVVQRLTAGWLGQRLQFLVLLFILAGFAVLTGLAASVIRASLMGIILPLARLVYRPKFAPTTLVMLVVAIGLVNPYIVIHDLGFQLSCLATIGIIYWQPFWQRVLRAVPNFFWLRETLTTSLAAMLLTTPLIIWRFGTFATVSLMANIVVVPVSTILLFAGSGTLLLSFINHYLGLWVAYPLWQIIEIVLRYLTWLLTWPGAFIENIIVPVQIMAVIFIIMFINLLWRALSPLACSR